MEIGWRHVLAGVAALFILFLVVKMRPARKRRDALSAEVQAARERARRAATPRERAEALCDAGVQAMHGGRRVTAAVGFFVRAMRADPTSARVIELASGALAKRRPRLLEKILWRRLAVLPWDAEHRDAVRAAAAGLEALYRRGIRDRSRAEIMRKLTRTLG
ncbi:hypothetical protein WME90_12630 [Sorangium sp. So ce375]|jgi:hypothetical protein|uniref:hypothetical protein n=1 Tax=Sorangium sp. So ce375 TaxID=3133306 RepID=UPI003F5B0245